MKRNQTAIKQQVNISFICYVVKRCVMPMKFMCAVVNIYLYVYNVLCVVLVCCCRHPQSVLLVFGYLCSSHSFPLCKFSVLACFISHLSHVELYGSVVLHLKKKPGFVKQN